MTIEEEESVIEAAREETEAVIQISKEMLYESGTLSYVIGEIKNNIRIGVHHKVLKLMDDPDRLDDLATKTAELYSEIGFTEEEAKVLKEFQCTPIGRKVTRHSAVLARKSVEITSEWLGSIIEEVEEEEEDAQETAGAQLNNILLG